MNENINLELLLRDLYESMTELSILLDDEHKAISEIDPVGLDEITGRKENLSTKIQILDKQRQDILNQTGFNNDLEGMTLLIKKLTPENEDSLYKLWNMVSDLAQECTTKNKLIGIIIEAKRRQTNAALSILQGYQESNAELYDSEGSTVPSKSNNSIAQA